VASTTRRVARAGPYEFFFGLVVAIAFVPPSLSLSLGVTRKEEEDGNDDG
jgi:hypothetical protein